ncbi:MAG TPA: VOC family protein [Ferruginibacter sp.]|nr:VOC family protein [Chitinophagaceae bacterium]HRI26397.1 VOC family protein [Ferruginibacter sp.]
MPSANVYLTFNGNCEEAFNFYRSVLGGEFSYMGRFNEMPAYEGSKPIPAEDAEKIMHVCLPISKETMLMGSDTGGEWAPGYTQGNNFSISLTVSSREEADRLFTGLSNNGTITMPMNATFWGDYFGMFTDKFGINWMISFHEEQKQ